MGKSAFEEKLDIVHVERAEIFQDSLEELPQHINKMLDQSASKQAAGQSVEGEAARTKVINEEGQHCEVIFDPVLKCYYEPKTNVYYQVKDVQKASEAAAI